MDLNAATLAVVVDPTGAESGSARASAAMRALKVDAGMLDEAHKKLNGSINDMMGPLQALSGMLGQVGLSFSSLAGGLAAVKFSEFIQDATQVAARVETLDVVMRAVGNSVGKTGLQMQEAAAGVRKMGITMQESQSTVVNMAQAHIKLSDASKLARVAQDAAVVGGINSSEALGRMIHGIQSGETIILRTMGINVNFEQSYEKLAVQLGKNALALTETEKAQARANAVMEKGRDIAGAYEGAMGTAGKMMQSVARYTEDTKERLGELFLPAYTDAVHAYYDAWKLVSGGLEALSSSQNGEKSALESTGATIRTVVHAVEGLGIALAGIGVGKVVSSVGTSIAQAYSSVTNSRNPEVTAAVTNSQAALVSTQADQEAAAAAQRLAVANRDASASLMAKSEAALASATSEEAAVLATARHTAVVAQLAKAEAGLIAANEAVVVSDASVLAGQVEVEVATIAATTATNRLTVAQIASAGAARAAAGAADLLKGAWGFIGGWVGVVTTLAMAVGAAAMSTSEAQKAGDAYAKSLEAQALNAAGLTDAEEKLAQDRADRARRGKLASMEDTASSLRGGLGLGTSAADTFGSLSFYKSLATKSWNLATSSEARSAQPQIDALRSATDQTDPTSLRQFELGLSAMSRAAKDSGFAADLRDMANQAGALGKELELAKKKKDEIDDPALGRANELISASNDAASAAIKKSGLAGMGGGYVTQDVAELKTLEDQIHDATGAYATMLNEGAVGNDRLEEQRKHVADLSAAFSVLSLRMDPVASAMKKMGDEAALKSFKAYEQPVAAAFASEYAKKNPTDTNPVSAQYLRDRMASPEGQALSAQNQALLSAGVQQEADAQASKLAADAVRAAERTGHGAADAISNAYAGALEKAMASGLSQDAATKAIHDPNSAYGKFAAQQVKAASLNNAGAANVAIIGAEERTSQQERVTGAAGKTDWEAKLAGIENEVQTFINNNGAARAGEMRDALIETAKSTQAAEVASKAQQFRIDDYKREQDAMIGIGEAAQREASQLSALFSAKEKYGVGSSMYSAIAEQEAKKEIDTQATLANATMNSMTVEVEALERKSAAIGKGIAGEDEAARSEFALTLKRKLGTDQTEAYTKALDAFNAKLALSHQIEDKAAMQAVNDKHGVSPADVNQIEQYQRLRASLLNSQAQNASARSTIDPNDAAAVAALKKNEEANAASLSALDKEWEKYYIGLLDKSDNWADGAERGIRKYMQTAGDMASQMEKITSDVLQGTEDAFVEMEKTGQVSFDKLAETVITDIMRMQIKAAESQLLGVLFGTGGNASGGGVGGGSSAGSTSSLGSGAGMVGGIAGMGVMGKLVSSGSSSLSSLWNGSQNTYAGSGAVDTSTLAADMNNSNIGSSGLGDWFSGLFGSAKGNVFMDGSPIQGFARGGVFHGKKTFQFANGGVPGLGELAEAGRSEAIVPLVRGSNGDLGIQSHGGGGGTQVSVQVIDQRTNAGSEAIAVEQSMTQYGPMIRIIAKDEANKRVADFKTNEMPAMMRVDYRMAPPPIQRG